MSNLSGDAFVEQAEKIVTKEDFVAFVNALVANFRQHRVEWENDTIESFLNGLSGFAQNSAAYYANIGLAVDENQPSWRTLADYLLAARVYE